MLSVCLDCNFYPSVRFARNFTQIVLNWRTLSEFFSVTNNNMAHALSREAEVTVLCFGMIRGSERRKSYVNFVRKVLLLNID